MGKRKLSPLVQAMTLFNQMDERDKVTLADYIKSQTAVPRKAAAKKPAKPAACVTCGSEEFVPDHQPESASYHIFRTTLKKRGGKSETVILPDNPEDFHKGATA